LKINDVIVAVFFYGKPTVCLASGQTRNAHEPFVDSTFRQEDRVFKLDRQWGAATLSSFDIGLADEPFG
jgi:hypothetical protein